MVNSLKVEISELGIAVLHTLQDLFIGSLTRQPELMSFLRCSQVTFCLHLSVNVTRMVIRFDTDRAGWLALLAHWWERRFDVVNRGFSGYNTRWLLPLAKKLFVKDAAAAAPPELVMIFLGANDCVLPGAAQHGQ